MRAVRTWTVGALLACYALATRALLVGGGDKTACQLLDTVYSRTALAVSVYGARRAVRVSHEGGGSGRAAAALLAALLRRALTPPATLALLPPAAHTLCDLATRTQTHCDRVDSSSAIYDNIYVSASLSVPALQCRALERCARGGRDAYVSAPRMRTAGPAAAPLALLLHARLATYNTRAVPHLPHQPCERAHHWSFYTDLQLLHRCGFSEYDRPGIVYTLADREDVTKELSDRINASGLHLDIEPLEEDIKPRTKLLRLIEESKSSFLFVDYDIWSEKSGVVRVSPPPRADGRPAPLDPTRALRVADDFVLRQVAPQVLNTLHSFSPSPNDLREILELEANNTDLRIEEAACTWALKNKRKFESWYREDFRERYLVAVFLCRNDRDIEEYKKAARTVETMTNSKGEVNVGVYFVEIECSDKNQLNDAFVRSTLLYTWQRLIGVVGTGEGRARAGASAAGAGTALALYGAAGAVPDARATRLLAGSPARLAAAIHHFLLALNWNRLAVISDTTEIAQGLYNALKLRKLALHNTILNDTLANSLLENMQALNLHMNARIFFVNTNYETAEAVLCAAHALEMTDREYYAWIVRDWRATELKCANISVPMNHFTISFWWRGGNYTHFDKGGGPPSALRDSLENLWSGRTWPPHAASIADALQFLIECFQEFSVRHPDKVFDLHGNETVRLLLDSIKDKEISGVVQNFKFINGSLAEPLVFVDHWEGDSRKPLYVWRVEDDLVETSAVFNKRNIKSSIPRSDGAPFCMTTLDGDPFLPRCLDSVWFTTAACLVLSTLAIAVARRIRLNKMSRRDALLSAKLAAQRTYWGESLAEHTVEASALQVFQEVGAGSSGRVHYGVVRARGGRGAAVAAKRARAPPAAHAELLNEACALAPLRHPHVVRLVAVCHAAGTLLLLTEYAFFGDLADYLWRRRHLAGRPHGTRFDELDEAAHVSAAALTRLAAEAASALEYLAARRLVHRDVCASNCLVDMHRTLKLADFGLARSVASGEGGEPDAYLSHRHGLFPVLWMAPESLKRGIFTAASDVWSLGVLILELVTLGERPYGDWSPQRVTGYVLAGGCPPLSPYTSYETRELVMQCWRREAEERPAAGALAALLRARPTLLQAAVPPATPATPDHPGLLGTPDHPDEPVVPNDPDPPDAPGTSVFIDVPVAAPSAPLPCQETLL